MVKAAKKAGMIGLAAIGYQMARHMVNKSIIRIPLIRLALGIGLLWGGISEPTPMNSFTKERW